MVRYDVCVCVCIAEHEQEPVAKTTTFEREIYFLEYVFSVKIVYNLPGNEIRLSIIFKWNNNKREEKKNSHGIEQRFKKQSTSTRFHSNRATKKKFFFGFFCYRFVFKTLKNTHFHSVFFAVNI